MRKKMQGFIFNTVKSSRQTHTFRTGSKCPSKSDVCLIESQIKGVKKDSCLFYPGVLLIIVSVKRSQLYHCPSKQKVVKNV